MNDIENFKQNLNKTSRWLTLTGFVIVATVLFISIIMLFFDEKNDKEKTTTIKMDTSQTTLKINKEIKTTIIDFYNAINQKDIGTYQEFYADTLERFYLKLNVSRDDVISIAERFWNKNPYGLSRIDTTSFKITELDNHFVVLVKISISTDSTSNQFVDVISELKINNDNKIIYIRNYSADNNLQME